MISLPSHLESQQPMARCRNQIRFYAKEIALSVSLCRHQPPVTSRFRQVEILLRDDECEFLVVDKPGSIMCYPVNKLDRHSAERARLVTEEYCGDCAQRVYNARRVISWFLSEEVAFEKPLISIDRHMGLNKQSYSVYRPKL